MQLVICDMSGIVFVDGRANEKLLKIFKNLEKTKVSFCTGKSYRGTRECLRGFQFYEPIACENGALIMTLDGTILSKHLINQTGLDVLVQDMINQGVESIAFCDLDSQKYVFWVEKEISSLPKYFYSKYVTHDSKQFIRKLLNTETVRLIVHSKKAVDMSKYVNSFDVSKSADGFYSFTAKGINKRSAVYEIANYLNVQTQNLTIIGNDYNDIDMFNIFEAKKIAVGKNCPLELSSNADVCLDIEELEKYIQEMEK